MSIEKEPTPNSGGIVILTGDQIRELHAMAMTLDSLAGLLAGFAKTIRQISGEEPELALYSVRYRKLS